MSAGLVYFDASLLALQMTAFLLCPHMLPSGSVCYLFLFCFVLFLFFVFCFFFFVFYISFSNGINHIGLCLTLIASLKLKYLFKHTMSKCSHILSYQG